MAEVMEGLLDSDEVAALIGISRSRVGQLAQQGKLGDMTVMTTKDSRNRDVKRRYFSRSQVEAFAESRASDGRSHNGGRRNGSNGTKPKRVGRRAARAIIEANMVAIEKLLAENRRELIRVEKEADEKAEKRFRDKLSKVLS